MTDTNLLPCPFCGSEAGLSKGGRALCSSEDCIACDLFAPVEDWNRRTQPASVPDEVRRDAERYRWLAERGDSAQWMNIIRVDLDDFDSLEHAIDAAMSHTPDS